MPRCQRSFRRLADPKGNGARGGGRWVCSVCADAEVYESVVDADLLEYARLTEAACIRDFGSPSDTRQPTRLLLGLRPECVWEPASGCYEIYLQCGSDPLQLRFQIGHEVFHRVCSQGRIFHWTHEMLACLVSVRRLRASGFGDYADQREEEYARDALRLSLNDFLAADLWKSGSDYPPGFYGRAYATGLALQNAVGWHLLTRLARAIGPDGITPSIIRWQRGLSPTERAAIERILGITTGTGAL